jgi:phage terminase small subunit
MTKRKAPEDLLRRAQDDMSIKPRKKKSPEAKAKAIAKLRATAPNTSANLATLKLANPDRPLTDKQKLFVKEWASGETILNASIRAGYADSGAMGYRMSRDPAILKIYNIEKALYEEASQMTRKRVMDGILEGIEMAKLTSEPASVIAGWREVGKMCGYYEPVKRTIDVTVNGSVNIKRLESMSDSELLKLVKGEVTDVVFKEVEEMEAEDD